MKMLPKLERELVSLLLSCKFGLHFLFFCCCCSTLHFFCVALFSYQSCFPSADTLPCALLLWVFQQVLEAYTHKFSCSRMSLWNVCEIHRGIFNEWIQHTLLILSRAVPCSRTVDVSECVCSSSSRQEFYWFEHIILLAL